MSFTRTLLTVGPAPHLRTGYSLTRMHYSAIAGLVPVMAAAALFQPTTELKAAAASLCLMGAGFGLGGEYLIQLILRQPYHAVNGHGVLMGVILALLLPATAPWWVLLTGVLCALLIGKQMYGGIGSYPFHPALIGWMVLLLSWPHYLYPIGKAALSAGSSGEVTTTPTLATASACVIAITGAMGLLLTLLRHIRWEVPLGMLMGVALATVAFSFAAPGLGSPLSQIASGHVLLAAFFIAGDPTSSPANRGPLVIYGVGVGVFIMLVRAFGVWPDAIPFAVLLMNILNPLLDRLRPQPVALVANHG